MKSAVTVSAAFPVTFKQIFTRNRNLPDLWGDLDESHDWFLRTHLKVQPWLEEWAQNKETPHKGSVCLKVLAPKVHFQWEAEKPPPGGEPSHAGAWWNDSSTSWWELAQDSSHVMRRRSASCDPRLRSGSLLHTNSHLCCSPQSAPVHREQPSNQASTLIFTTTETFTRVSVLVCFILFLLLTCVLCVGVRTWMWAHDVQRSNLYLAHFSHTVWFLCQSHPPRFDVKSEVFLSTFKTSVK